MEQRSRPYEISLPRPIPPPRPPPPSAQPASEVPPTQPPTWTSASTTNRPLSDIRELSEPSLMDQVMRKSTGQFPLRRSASRGNPHQRREPARTEPARPLQPQALVYEYPRGYEAGSSSYSSTPPDQSSYYGIPHSSVPRRSSSQNHSQRPEPKHVRKPSYTLYPQLSLPPSSAHGLSIPNRGHSESPVKEAGLRMDPVVSDTARRVPSHTYVRNPHPIDVLEFPLFKHPRLRLELQVSAPVFVGGGSVEGYVKVTVDDNERLKHRRSLSIGAISVDLLGFEDMAGSRKSTFIALGTELIDTAHPPPLQMVQPANLLFAENNFWSLAPSTTALPFMISLPLDTGPPPFQSKHASIRFLLCATALVRDAGKLYRVRVSQDIQVLPTFDPEKALTSLPSPLTASDELSLTRGGMHESLKVTAGLHRQVWVSGSSIFVDIHIANKCRKAVRRLELTLERDILCYKHSAAMTNEKSAHQARIFESNEQTVLARASFKAGSLGWTGVEPHASDTRTCELELPRGHGTVRCGKFFEVRYFLNVLAHLSNSKLVSVQLPIILIHMNSLDVVPNSVAQVAAAIEEKRAHCHRKNSRSRGAHARQRSLSSPARAADLRRRPSYSQGRAFAAPRQQSLDRHREHRADMEDLRNAIDSSPRKYPPPSLQGVAVKKVASNVSLGTLGLGYADKTNESLGVLGAMTYQTTPPEQIPQHHGFTTKENAEPFRDRLRRMRSFDSIASKRSLTPGKQQPARLHQIAPHTLGLAATNAGMGADMPPPLTERAATAMSFREKLDRSRFEFKPVRRKASGGFKERSRQWLEQRMNRDREKEGWI